MFTFKIYDNHRVVASQILVLAKITKKLNQNTNYVIVMVLNSCFQENWSFASWSARPVIPLSAGQSG